MTFLVNYPKFLFSESKILTPSRQQTNLNHEHGRDVVSDVLRFQGSYDINSENAKQMRLTSQPRTKKKRTRPPSQTYDHIIAERRRREQLSQLFIALSAIVPGLKKVLQFCITSKHLSFLCEGSFYGRCDMLVGTFRLSVYRLRQHSNFFVIKYMVLVLLPCEHIYHKQIRPIPTCLPKNILQSLYFVQFTVTRLAIKK